MPQEILDEVSPGRDKDDSFYQWRKDKANIETLLVDEEIDQTLAQHVIDEGYAPDLTDDELLLLGADPFLVAYAMGHPDRTVVTTEVSAPRRQRQNRRLPDVCAQLGVRCINTFQMTRELGFRTDWKP
jgi:hypothetical protein